MYFAWHRGRGRKVKASKGVGMKSLIDYGSLREQSVLGGYHVPFVYERRQLIRKMVG